MSTLVEAARQALEAMENSRVFVTTREKIRHPEGTEWYDERITALRAAIEQAEKPVAWMHVQGNYKQPSLYQLDDFELDRKWNQYPLYTAPRQEHYDQTSLELCNECGWRAMIPGHGCLVCARQKAKPVWIPRTHLEAAQREPSMCRVEPTKRLPDFVPLYTAPPTITQKPVAWMYDFLSDNRDEVIRDWVTQSQDDINRENGFNVRPLYTAPPAAPKPYRRGTYVRCMESDELCRVWTTSIDGGAWVKWPDGSITTYTAEQMGQAFSLEQAAPGKPVAYVDERIHGWPDCFVMEPDPPHTVPLYTETRQWVGLTTQEIEDEWERVTGHSIFGGDRSAGRSMFLSPDEVIHYTQAIETKLKEKNA